MRPQAGLAVITSNILCAGLEKYELLAKQAGNEDPFFLKAVQRAKGTKDAPTIIHAMDNYRMVGCVCNEEDTNIKWTWLSEVLSQFSWRILTLHRLI